MRTNGGRVSGEIEFNELIKEHSALGVELEKKQDEELAKLKEMVGKFTPDSGMDRELVRLDRHFIREGALVKARLTDNQDGTYLCEYRPSVSGQFSIAVSLHGAATRRHEAAVR